jgi:hypothetical protein
MAIPVLRVVTGLTERFQSTYLMGLGAFDVVHVEMFPRTTPSALKTVP